jgi:hypothetical protein
LWQNILDTQLNVSYTADNEKQVLSAPIIINQYAYQWNAGIYEVVVKPDDCSEMIREIYFL